MYWCPVWSVAESTSTVSKFLIFGLVSNRSILCIDSSFVICFSFVDFKASEIVFFLFFFSYVFCLINSIIVFNSKVFSFNILFRNFSSVIAVVYFEISNSSAEIVLKFHSFSISIRRLQSSVLPRRNLRGYDKCLFSAFRIQRITGLSLSLLYCRVPFCTRP